MSMGWYTHTHAEIKMLRDPQQTHIGIASNSNIYSDMNSNTLP